MLRSSPSLQRLPRVMITPSAPSRYVIKQQPHAGCLSTLEATHELLVALERAGLDRYPLPDQLLDLFGACRTTSSCAAATIPTGEGTGRSAYGDPGQRSPARRRRRFLRGTRRPSARHTAAQICRARKDWEGAPDPAGYISRPECSLSALMASRASSKRWEGVRGARKIRFSPVDRPSEVITLAAEDGQDVDAGPSRRSGARQRRRGERYPLLCPRRSSASPGGGATIGDVAGRPRARHLQPALRVKIANEYRGYGARILDLVQEGSVGLMQAVKRFDPERGYRLLTYAVFWIRSYIHSFLMGSCACSGSARRAPTASSSSSCARSRAGSARDGMTDRGEVLATVAAERSGVTRAEAEEMDRHLAARDASLDAPKPETGTALVEILPGGGPSQEEELAELEVEADRAARLKTAMAAARRARARGHRGGYLADEPVQLKQLGEEMGVSKQRVAQIEKRALKKLRTCSKPREPKITKRR